jgi:DNA (cytosine-5)-methyltransferase 1
MKSKQQGLSNAVKMRWPTPRVSDIEGAPATNAEYNNGSWSRLNSKGVRFGIKLKDAVNYFPTPKAQNANSPGEHGRGGKDLQTIISKFPTPASRDYKGSSSKILEKGRNPLTNSLCDAIEHKTVGHLNPDWVEALMSWPIGWSSLEPMSIEVFNHWLANHHWEDWEPDIPRLVTGVKDRINRIKAIGNGQVPICMAVAFILLFNGIQERTDHEPEISGTLS